MLLGAKLPVKCKIYFCFVAIMLSISLCSINHIKKRNCMNEPEHEHVFWLLKLPSVQMEPCKPPSHPSMYKTIPSTGAACLISSWSYSINASGLN